jgi:hypothetical protein
MLRLSIVISILAYLLSFINGAYASSFTPGAVITMTGSNSDVRFDVAADLFWFDAVAPALISGTKTFTGAFYATGIGWIEFSTGGYQVWLDCGAQSITTLSTNCTLTNSGWSENIWEVGFTNAQYNPNTWLLEWKASSNMGDISLSGIALPLRPVIINESNIIANHASQITLSWVWIYEGWITPWNINITIFWEPGTSHDVAWNHGIFPVDFSLATQYALIVRDTNGSETTHTITILPGTPATSLDGNNFYAKTFCNGIGSGGIHCQDTTASLGDDNRTATILQIEPPVWSLVANGSDVYHHTMKVRDTYGNNVETGSIKLKYTTTIKAVQIDPFAATGNTNYWPSIDGDAFVSSELLTGLFWSSVTTKTVWITDFIYDIASLAPTNATDNIIKLDSISYISGTTETVIVPANSPLSFIPLFTASTSSTAVPIIGVTNTFSSIVTKNDPSTIITPYIISTLVIGDGTNAEWRTLSSNPIAQCSHEPYTSLTHPIDNLCDWNFVSSIATQTGSDFDFLATYTGRVPTPPLESTILKTYVYYNNGSIDILYPLPDTTINPPLTATERMRVFGQISEGMGIGSQNRVTIINKLRENTALLSRNRSNYTNADYNILIGDQILTDADFVGKRTIVTIGGDITINTNISIQDRPLAIIALANTQNQGGNIRIKWNVSDIHSTLIAEHGLTSEVSNTQLYIHGSIISANPPREVAPTDCPYFTSSSCTRSNYDLPTMRAGYVSPTNSSLSGSLYVNPLIIVSDTRLMTDPPPTLTK